MKFFVSGSAIILLIVLSFFEVGVSSCTKDHNIYDTVTVIKKDTVNVIQKDTVTVKDTVTIKDTMLTAEILAANSWKIQEIRGTIDNDIQYYLRGGLANTESFDNEYITFNTDGTGTYIDNVAHSTAITWVFDNAENKKMTLRFYNTPATFDIVWDNIRYKNKNLNYDEYYTDGNTGLNAHKQTIRMPK